MHTHLLMTSRGVLVEFVRRRAGTRAVLSGRSTARPSRRPPPSGSVSDPQLRGRRPRNGNKWWCARGARTVDVARNAAAVHLDPTPRPRVLQRCDFQEAQGSAGTDSPGSLAAPVPSASALSPPSLSPPLASTKVGDERWESAQGAPPLGRSQTLVLGFGARRGAPHIEGTSPHADEIELVGTLTPPSAPGSGRCHLGLHVDTNGDREWRCALLLCASSGVGEVCGRRRVSSAQ